MTQEALKLALEAADELAFMLTCGYEIGREGPPRVHRLISKIREFAAQPQQEPVACVQDLDEVKRKHLVYEKGMDWKDPLYTSPPQRKPLPEDQLMGIWNKAITQDNGRGSHLSNQPFVHIARAIEAAHGIKE